MRLTTAALLCVIAVALAGCGEVAPSDKSMRETFLAKRQAFETLRTELCKLRYDLTINRDPPWTQPQIPAADEKRFLAEMDVLGARSVKYLRGCQLWIEIWYPKGRRETSCRPY